MERREHRRLSTGTIGMSSESDIGKCHREIKCHLPLKLKRFDRSFVCTQRRSHPPRRSSRSLTEIPSCRSSSAVSCIVFSSMSVYHGLSISFSLSFPLFEHFRPLFLKLFFSPRNLRTNCLFLFFPNSFSLLSHVPPL